MILLIMLQISNLIQGNATIANVTSLSGGYAYANAASGGLISWAVFLVLFFALAGAMLLKDVDIAAAGLASSTLLVLISTLASGVTVNGLSLGAPLAPYIFGGIAFVCFIAIAFNGAQKSY
jgi:hypothetical protein